MRLADGVIDVSQPTPAVTPGRVIASVLGIGVLVVLAPIAILLLGLPVALLVRGLLEAMGWF